MQLDGRTVTVVPAPVANAPVVYVPSVSDNAEALAAACHGLGAPGFSLVCVSGLDWDADLSPWPAENVFKGQPPFAGRAPEFLGWMEHRLIPTAEEQLPSPDTSHRIAAGYSLAGLFALWAPYHTDAFCSVVSASGSLWFPGFLAICERLPFVRKPRRAYLSLGKKESRSRNPLLRETQGATEALARRLVDEGVDATFVLNPGGHFDNPTGRLAAGIAWALARRTP